MDDSFTTLARAEPWSHGLERPLTHRIWAFKACYYEFIARELADGEIIKDLSAQIVSGVGRLLYDDAIQATNRLRNPQPISREAVKDVDMAAIRAATA